MTRSTTMNLVALLRVVLLVSLVCSAPIARAQDKDDVLEMKERANKLLKQTNYVEALPILEKLAKLEPEDGETRYYLASALLGQAANAKDESSKKALRVRARNEFLKAKQLGFSEPNIDAMILSIPEDGSSAGEFSRNTAAHKLMEEGEALFTQGKLDEALKKYQKALELDPQLYNAALFSGDVFLQKNDFAQAEVWYLKAISIDPNRETAYRYSATPLMKQGRTAEARDRYIEAFITEPYNRFARAGLVRWAQTTGAPLGHPEIKIPTSVTFDEKGNSKINMDPAALSDKDGGGAAWMMYGMKRVTWRKETFAKTFPKETTYRHSLAEELEALRSAINLAFSDEKKPTSPSLIKLKKLNDEGLLESYILLALADDGIARDHPAYLKENRAKLRKYMTDYVVKGGGD